MGLIETRRLILRSWREEDVQPFDEGTNTAAVMRWLGPVAGRADVAAALARYAAWEAERGFTFWAVERRDDAALLGFCGLKLSDSDNFRIKDAVKIGWRLREDAWGQGFAKEAATATLDFAFGTLDAPLVVSKTVAGNAASWGLMERLGMVRRPDLDYHDARYADDLNPTIVYLLEAETWAARS